MRLKCNHVKNLLSDYLDGVLSENQTFAIAKHLRSCRVCQHELETLEKTNQVLKLYIEKSPPDDYFQQLWPNLKHQIEHRNSYNQLSFQRLATLLMLKFKGLKANLLVKCEEIKTNLNSQWYKLLVQCAVVVCLISIGIFLDRTYIRPPHKVVAEFIRDSLYSPEAYQAKFFVHQKPNDNRTPVGYQIKDISWVKEEERENIFNALPVLHGKVGAIDIDLHPVSFQGGILTLVADLSDVSNSPSEQPLMANQQANLNSTEQLGEFKQLLLNLDSPKGPRMSSKSAKFEGWLTSLLTDVTLPTLSIADASNLENVATSKISD